MYIQNMTMEEMVREYRADLPEIEAENGRIDGSEFTAKLLRKARKSDTVSFTRYYTTTRNNRYVNIYQYVKADDSTSRSVKWSWCVRSIALMQTYKGLSAIAFFEDAKIVILFQQHFFMRYKERLLETCDWKTRNELTNATTIEKIIAVWGRRNPDITWINTQSKFDNREHIFAPINDGAILMQWDGKCVQANTFITDKMCSSKQAEMFEKACGARLEKAGMDIIFHALIGNVDLSNI